jgi:ankyrin repeat protein
MGETPLHYAARAGHINVVKLLLINGADKTKRGKRGTPVDVAHDTNIVRLLQMFRKIETTSVPTPNNSSSSQSAQTSEILNTIAIHRSQSRSGLKKNRNQTTDSALSSNGNSNLILNYLSLSNFVLLERERERNV